MILTLTGALLAAAYAVDTTRLTADTSQLKRATDAAALAVAREYSRGSDDFETRRDTLAEDYVRANLGMDEALGETLEAVSVTEGRSTEGNLTFQVEANFTNTAELTGYGSRPIAVHSTAEVRVSSIEVALAIPNTLSEGSANLAVLRRLAKSFAEDLISDNDHSWLSLVPYSQAVSVYDSEHTNRIRQWATPAGLKPVELTSLFNAGYSDLANPRIPDRRAKLLCLYRGLNRGENYFWEEAPSGQFQIYYRADLPENDIAYGITPYTVTWVGPNPGYGQASGANDTRYLIADRGCPSAPLLPLSNDLDKIGERLDAMSTRFNVNYAIPMGWSAMALAPAFRGGAGWDLGDKLPMDFDDGTGERVKAIILLVNSTGQRWFDTDAYNAYTAKSVDGCVTAGDANCNNYESLTTERFANLCSSFRARRLRFFLIVTGNDEASDEDGQITSASAFRRIAGAGLQGCAEKSSDLTYFSGADFTESESLIEARLEAIVQELRQAGGFVRLIE